MKKGIRLGEKVIEGVLRKHGLIFTKTLKLTLKGDKKKYRIPDFYVFKYDLAIEYFGTWNFPKSKMIEAKERERFMEKADLYSKNKINCLYIMPFELDYVEEKILYFVYLLDENREQKTLKWVIPWLEQKKIEMPESEDFSDSTIPLNWDLSWLEREKIDAPLEEDFLEKPKKVIKEKEPGVFEKFVPEKKESVSLETLIALTGVVIGLIIFVLIAVLIYMILTHQISF